MVGESEEGSEGRGECEGERGRKDYERERWLGKRGEESEGMEY